MEHPEPSSPDIQDTSSTSIEIFDDSFQSFHDPCSSPCSGSHNIWHSTPRKDIEKSVATCIPDPEIVISSDPESDVEVFDESTTSVLPEVSDGGANSSRISVEVFEESFEVLPEVSDGGANSSRISVEVFEESFEVAETKQNPESSLKSENSKELEIFTPQKLSGKRVFLFLNSHKSSTHRIEDFVKFHGGHIRMFLQKNVDFVIMDMTLQREAPLSTQINYTRSWQLMEMSKKKSGSSSVEVFAEKWNIPLIDHREVLHYCQTAIHQEKMYTCKGKKKKLQAPFIKVEDRSRKYRPDFVEFKSFPFIDTAVPLPHSPFDTWHKANSKANKDVINEKESRLHFCELCNEEYEVLQLHLDSTEHKHAAMDDANYAGVDALIKRGVSWEDFVKSVKEKSTTAPCKNEESRLGCS